MSLTPLYFSAVASKQSDWVPGREYLYNIKQLTYITILRSFHSVCLLRPSSLPELYLIVFLEFNIDTNAPFLHLYRIQ